MTRQRRTRVWILVLLLGVSAAAAGFVIRRCGQGASRRGTRPPRATPARPAADERRALRERIRALRERLSPRVRVLWGTVRGRDGAPVGGAIVRIVLETGGIRLARAGADGGYVLANPPERAPRMEVSAAGYQTRRYAPMVLPAGARVRWDVVLDPEDGVRGLVLSGDRPVSGARVVLMPEGHRRAWARAETDLGGRFHIRWPGGDRPRRLVAFHGQYGRAAVTVRGPEEVVLRLPEGGFVEGRVVDDAGHPVRRFGVSATSLARGAGAPPAQFFDDAEGRFRLGPLAPGRQRLFAFGEGYQPTTGTLVRIRSGETVRGVRLVLRASGEIYGRVTDAATGRPIPGAVVAPAEWGSRALGESAGATADDSGAYRLRTVPGTRTSLRVWAEGYQPLLAGGVECPPGTRVRRDFALTPVRRGDRPRGQITGVGAVLRASPRGVQVLHVLDGGPAAEVLQPGDVIVMVDGKDVRRAGLRSVVQAIRGEAGSQVVVWVDRGGGEPERLVLTRDVVTLPGPRRRR